MPYQNAGFTRDIGVGGVFIFAQRCPPKGAMVKVELLVPLSEETGREVRLQCVGKVLRTEINLPHGQGFAVAGDFGDQNYPQIARA